MTLDLAGSTEKARPTERPSKFEGVKFAAVCGRGANYYGGNARGSDIDGALLLDSEDALRERLKKDYGGWYSKLNYVIVKVQVASDGARKRVD